MFTGPVLTGNLKHHGICWKVNKAEHKPYRECLECHGKNFLNMEKQIARPDIYKL